MCKIILLFLLYSGPMFASSKKFSLNYDYRSFEMGNYLTTAENNGSCQSQTVGYQNESILPGLGISGSLTSQNANYAKVLNSTGQFESTVGQNFAEYISSAQFDYGHGDHSVSLGGHTYLSSSPYFQNGARAVYKFSWFGSAVGTRLQYVDQHRPESYYYNQSFILTQKSIRVFSHEYAVFYEQIFNKNWKGAVELSTSQKVNDRPINFGVAIKQGYAFTSHLFSQLKLNYKAEDRSKPLKDDRGYYSVVGGEMIVTYEPVFDLLLSGSYALNVEREFNPWTGSELQVGSDHFGLGAKYSISRAFDVELQGAYAKTNTQLSDYSVRGGLIWNQ